jgi:hypothetical protein
MFAFSHLGMKVSGQLLAEGPSTREDAHPVIRLSQSRPDCPKFTVQLVIGDLKRPTIQVMNQSLFAKYIVILMPPSAF